MANHQHTNTNPAAPARDELSDLELAGVAGGSFRQFINRYFCPQHDTAIDTGGSTIKVTVDPSIGPGTTTEVSAMIW